MKKFLNAFNYDPQLIEHEVNEKPSKTVPEMTMSLRQLLERYTRGGEIATLQPVYQDHDDFDENPEIAKMDTMERMQYAADLKQVIHDYQNRPQVREQKGGERSSALEGGPGSPPKKTDSSGAEPKPEKSAEGEKQ